MKVVCHYSEAAIAKLIWNLRRKKETLWVQWIHSYIKGKDVWDVQIPQASWLMQKILKGREILEEVGCTCDEVNQLLSLSIKKLYQN